MTAPFPRVEAYLWSDAVSPPVFRGVQRFAAAEGVATSDRVLSAPLRFSAALDAIVAGLSADLPGAYSWSMTPAGVLTLASDGAVWSITWHGSAQAAFGFVGGQAGASSYASAASVLLCAPALCFDLQPADDGAIVELVEARKGRAFATHFAALERWRVRLMTRAAVAEAFRAGYCGRGRVRIYPGSDTNEVTATNLDGYLDGWVYGCAVSAPDEASGFVEVELLIARATP